MFGQELTSAPAIRRMVSASVHRVWLRRVVLLPLFVVPVAVPCPVGVAICGRGASLFRAFQ